MKKSLSYLVVLLISSVGVYAAGADTDAIKAKETAAWQSFKDKKADDFKKVVDKEFAGVYSDGIVNFQQEVDDMKNWDIKSFTFSDYKAFSDEPDVIVTTYTVTLSGTKGAKDISGTYNCGSVWKKEGTDWLAIFHTNIKQEAAAK